MEVQPSNVSGKMKDFFWDANVMLFPMLTILYGLSDWPALPLKVPTTSSSSYMRGSGAPSLGRALFWS